MSRTIQVTFDARDPRAQSRFWAQALGYTIPGPPGVDVPEGSDPLQAWGDFLTRLGASCLSARDEPPRDLGWTAHGFMRHSPSKVHPDPRHR